MAILVKVVNHQTIHVTKAEIERFLNVEISSIYCDDNGHGATYGLTIETMGVEEE